VAFCVSRWSPLFCHNHNASTPNPIPPAPHPPQKVLSHEINHGFKLGMIPVESFNGRPINNLSELAAAVDGSAEPFLNFQLEGGRWVTLDAAQVGEQGEEVLRVNSIPRDRSDDLVEAAAANGGEGGGEGSKSGAAAAAASSSGGGGGGVGGSETVVN